MRDEELWRRAQQKRGNQTEVFSDVEIASLVETAKYELGHIGGVSPLISAVKKACGEGDFAIFMGYLLAGWIMSEELDEVFRRIAAARQ